MYLYLLKEYKDNLGKVIKTENWIKENEWTSKETWYDGDKDGRFRSNTSLDNPARLLYSEGY